MLDKHNNPAVRLRKALHALYGTHANFDAWFVHLSASIDAVRAQRPTALLELDRKRSALPNWFGAPTMIGYCAYVDRFGGDLRGVENRITHLQSLGVTYLHLLPFLKARAGESDGGFAIADYETVDARFGTNDDLISLTQRLREANISLCCDLVMNHVADDHAWAQRAKVGDERYLNYFRTYADRTIPDQYEKTVAQIFPQTAPGNFTWSDPLKRWVWTTFYPYQWDLNYENPEVFAEMALTMLRLANRGVEVFRIDSAPFIWKTLGTPCLNLPQCHTVLQAFRCIIEWAAPACILKSEAIVPAADSAAYFGDDNAAECHVAYHSALMASSWAALATQDVSMMHAVVSKTPALHGVHAWMTYVRCHDDIVWAVLRPEIEARGEDFHAHLAPVAQFLAGVPSTSFARGGTFQSASPTHVHGSVGMAASLVGFDVESEVDIAFKRMEMLYALAFSFGGVPLLYMGDELAQTNATDAQTRALATHDSRWLQRPRWKDGVRPPNSAKMLALMQRLVNARAANVDFAAEAAREIIAFKDAVARQHVFAFTRGSNSFCAFNFSAQAIKIEHPENRASQDAVNHVTLASTITLAPWSFVWSKT